MSDRALGEAEPFKVDKTWQTEFKRLQWVDEVTREPLVDEAVIFDGKVHPITARRKVLIYPLGRRFPILKGSRRAVYARREGKAADDAVDVAFIFDPDFQAQFDRQRKTLRIRKVKSQSLSQPSLIRPKVL